MNIKLQKDWTLAHFISYIAAMAAILLGVQLLIQLVMYNHAGMEFPVKYSVESTERLGSITKDGIIFLPEHRQEGRLIISGTDDRAAIHSFFLFSFTIVHSGLFIFCAFLVWQLFRSVAANSPFSDRNYKRLFTIGWIFVIAELFGIGRAFYLDWLTFDAFASDPVTLIRSTGDVSNFMILGIVIIVIGYVFKEGHRMYEEQKLTV